VNDSRQEQWAPNITFGVHCCNSKLRRRLEGKLKKQSEHGGFHEDDVHVALLVSNPSLDGKVIKSAVSNQQVAASIVRALGINPNELDAVHKEQIHVLRFLSSDGDGDNRR
jgi:hypothetical protein